MYQEMINAVHCSSIDDVAWINLNVGVFVCIQCFGICRDFSICIIYNVVKNRRFIIIANLLSGTAKF